MLLYINAFVPVPADIGRSREIRLLVISIALPASYDVPPPPSMVMFPSPRMLWLLMVFIFVPDTKVSCFVYVAAVIALSVSVFV